MDDEVILAIVGVIIQQPVPDPVLSSPPLSPCTRDDAFVSIQHIYIDHLLDALSAFHSDGLFSLFVGAENLQTRHIYARKENHRKRWSLVSG